MIMHAADSDRVSRESDPLNRYIDPELHTKMENEPKKKNSHTPHKEYRYFLHIKDKTDNLGLHLN